MSRPLKDFCPMCWGQKVIWEQVGDSNAMIPVKCDECFGLGYVTEVTSNDAERDPERIRD